MKNYEPRDKERDKDFINYFEQLDWQSQDEIIFKLRKINNVSLSR